MFSNLLDSPFAFHIFRYFCCCLVLCPRPPSSYCDLIKNVIIMQAIRFDSLMLFSFSFHFRSSEMGKLYLIGSQKCFFSIKFYSDHFFILSLKSLNQTYSLYSSKEFFATFFISTLSLSKFSSFFVSAICFLHFTFSSSIGKISRRYKVFLLYQ